MGDKMKIRFIDKPSNYEPIEGETWKPIFDKYEISDHGRIRTWYESKKYVPGDIISACKVYTKKSYYLSASLKTDKGTRLIPVHRLVALHFLGPSNSPVRHKDGDRTNNRVDNLCYSSLSECIKQSYDLGEKPKFFGKAHWRTGTKRFVKKKYIPIEIVLSLTLMELWKPGESMKSYGFDNPYGEIRELSRELNTL